MIPTPLFSGSIADSIRVGRCEATPRQILSAVAMTNAKAFIVELPDGFQTEIGERSVRLSGGQRQRLAIARAFLKDAPILILDESTSNLDGPSRIQEDEALERLMAGRTTLIIAHRFSTVMRAHRFVVLEPGRILQDGTHADLLHSLNGAYSGLYQHDLSP